MRIFLVAAVLGVAVLTGCAPSGADAGATATPDSSSAPPTATPVADPTALGEPTVTLSELVLSPEGIGPIRMGQAVQADAAVAQLDAAYCDSNHPDSGHGGWVPNYPPTPVNGNYPFFLESAEAAVDSPVIWIAVGSDEIRTAEGLGIGSTIAELNAFYGSAIATIETDMAVAHVVQGANGQLVFWGLEVVDGVEISPAGSEPVFYYTLMCH